MDPLIRLKNGLAHLTALVLSAEHKLEIAGNRWQANHDAAHAQHHAQKVAEARYRKLSREGHKAGAEAELRKANRCKHRALMAHRRAIHFIDKAKQYAAQLAHLKSSAAVHEAAIHKIERERGPHRTAPNRVEGGTIDQGFKLALHLSMLHGSKFYSQVGPTDVFHGITGPTSGHRHDCSSWFTSIYHVLLLPNPNNGTMEYSNLETMFTGSLGEHGKSVNESELTWGDAILFGFAPFHHVEMKYGPMSQTNLTVGHGSAPIDFGNTSLLPGPRAFRRFPK